MKKKLFFKLILITNKQNQSSLDYLDFISQFIQFGVTAVQLRQKHSTNQQILKFGQKLQQILKPLSIPLIINDNLEVAHQLDADGIHLGQQDVDIKVARQLLGNDKIIGLSINSMEQLEKAKSLPIDYIGVGSIFPTFSKDNIKIIGCDLLKKIAAASKFPVIAIGGINEFNAKQVMDAGADGIAAIEAFNNSQDPIKTSNKLSNIVEAYNYA